MNNWRGTLTETEITEYEEDTEELNKLCARVRYLQLKRRRLEQAARKRYTWRKKHAVDIP